MILFFKFTNLCSKLKKFINQICLLFCRATEILAQGNFGLGRKVTGTSTVPKSHCNFTPGRKVTAISLRTGKSPELRPVPKSHCNFIPGRKVTTTLFWTEKSSELRPEPKVTGTLTLPNRYRNFEPNRKFGFAFFFLLPCLFKFIL
jgi:hypothetical protein